MTYFAQFDGKTTWEEALHTIERLYHPELVVTTGKGNLNREEFKRLVQKHIESGASIELLKLEKVSDGIRYELIFHNPDGTTLHTKTIGVFRDGQLYYVKPDDPGVYTKVFEE